MTPERPRRRTSAAELAGIFSGGAGGSVEQVLDAAREMLGMEVVFVAEFAGERMVFRAVGGDAESFGWSEGSSVPLEGTYWRGMVEGSLPGVVPDARSDERVKDLDITREARRASAPASACPCSSPTAASTARCAPSITPRLPRSRSATPGSCGRSATW
jgi:hypothetical protein